MMSNPKSQWWPRSAAFVLWALAAASAAFWGLRMTDSRAGLQAPAVANAPAGQADAAAVGRLLGAAVATPSAAAPNVASRFVLTGVVAAASHRGAALIAVDGKPPKPFRVGARIDDNLVLQSVAPRQALLGAATDGPALITLELPALKP